MQCTLQTNMQTINICFALSNVNGVTKRSILRVIYVWQICYAIELYCVRKLIFLLYLDGKQAKYTLND